MKSSMPSFGKALQKALQLDLFSDIFGTPRVQPPTPPHLQPGLEKPPSLRPDMPPEPGNQKARRRVRLDDYVLEYELLRSKRRSIGFLINDQGLRITAPRWVTLADIEQAIGEKQTWIRKKLAERHERIQKRLEPEMRWVDGARIPYLGKQISLRLAGDAARGTYLDTERNELYLQLPAFASEAQFKDRVQGWLQQEAKRVFNERLPVFAEKLQVRYQSMSLSAAKTRWGSCTSQGKIRLNWRLIHFSPQIIDYVIAHELAHLREMNHSPRFWATVQSVFPEMESAKQQLRLQSNADMPQF